VNSNGMKKIMKYLYPTIELVSVLFVFLLENLA